MDITAEETKKIADLSKLNIADHELTHFTDALGSILDMFAQLQTADTSKVDHLSIMPNVKIREMQQENPSQPEDHTAEMTGFSPYFDANHGEFLSPKVID